VERRCDVDSSLGVRRDFVDTGNPRIPQMCGDKDCSLVTGFPGALEPCCVGDASVAADVQASTFPVCGLRVNQGGCEERIPGLNDPSRPATRFEGCCRPDTNHCGYASAFGCVTVTPDGAPPSACDGGG
jgi:hypothetical protein